VTARPGGARRPAAERPGADRAAARRIPDLAALPPLLHATAPFRDLRARLAGPAGASGCHAAVTAVPHGAKSFLVAALALAEGAQVCWIARDAEIGDRVADELVAWLGDPEAVAVLEPRSLREPTSGAN
jgi:hypothetical protein